MWTAHVQKQSAATRENSWRQLVHQLFRNGELSRIWRVNDSQTCVFAVIQSKHAWFICVLVVDAVKINMRSLWNLSKRFVHLPGCLWDVSSVVYNYIKTLKTSGQTGFRSNFSLPLSVSYSLFFCFTVLRELSCDHNVRSVYRAGFFVDATALRARSFGINPE